MVWLSLLLGTTYLDRPDGEEWVWFAHVYEPKSPDCWNASLDTLSVLTGFDVAGSADLGDAASSAEAAGGTQEELVGRAGSLFAYYLHRHDVVLLVRAQHAGEDDWLVVAGHDPTRVEPWLVSRCRAPNPMWWTTEKLLDEQSDTREVLLVGQKRALDLDGFLDKAMRETHVVTPIEPELVAMHRSLTRDSHASFVIPAAPVGGRQQHLVAFWHPQERWLVGDVESDTWASWTTQELVDSLAHGDVVYALVPKGERLGG